MSKENVSQRRFPRRLLPSCLLLAFAWLVWPRAVMPQPADQPEVRIEIVEGIHLGEPVEVSITWTNNDSTFEVGGFDLLIAYDPSGLLFLGVDQGQLLTDCEWEYFSYSMETPPDTCVYWCPPMVRIVAIAETNNGPVHPSCYLDVPGELAKLHFLATRSPGALCTLYPVRFFWMDCGDNTFSSKTGDSLFASHYVIEFGHGGFAYRIEDEAHGFPTYFGVQSECLGGDPAPIQFIDFFNGSVEFSCQDTSSTWGASVIVGKATQVWLRDTFDIYIDLYSISSDLELGGFDLLLDFDPSGLIFLSAQQGQLLTDCEWEYFTYQNDSTRIRVVAVADINDGAHHPTCYANTPGRLVDLSFQLPNDSNLICQTIPVRCIWYDCGDNAFSSKTGISLLISREVYDFNGFPITQDSAFPTPYGAPDVCLSSSLADSIVRAFDYFTGGVRVACGHDIDFRGDVNLNGIAYEMTDYSLFIDYFVFGPDVFVIDPPVQEAATDANADGLTLTIDDLVYLYRVVIGDAVPYPKVPIPDEAVFFQDDFSKTISVSYPDSLTAAYLVFRGNIVPSVLVDNIGVAYHFDGWFTSVLIYPNNDQVPAFGTGPLVTYTGYGQLNQTLVADYGEQQIGTRFEVAWTINTKTEIEPDSMPAYWAYAIDPIMAKTCVGNIPDDSVLDVTDIDVSTVRVNDDIVPDSIQILPDRPGFNGSVMEITFSATEMVRGYLPFYDTTSHLFTVSGQLIDSTPFLTYCAVFLMGHISGDVNVDGAVNVTDLTYLVEFLFFGGPPPRVIETADLNYNGSVEVADLTLLVELLF